MVQTRDSDASASASVTDEASFRQLYARTAGPLLAYIRRVSGDPDLAEDLVQDTYVRFLAADRPEMTERQTSSYLYRIATRLVYDRWRRNETERRWREKTDMATTAKPEAVGLQRDVERVLQELAPRERALLWLAYVEGYPHREIATIMKLKEVSIRVLLFRARKKLARILDANGLTPEVLG